jgi:hypothetical protein
LPETGLFILRSSFDELRMTGDLLRMTGDLLRMTGDLLRMTEMVSTLSLSKGRTMSTVY